jgi:hypothetical protein
MKQYLLADSDGVIFGDNCRNEYGSIRQKFVRYHYDIGDIDINNVLDFYPEWRDDTEYFCLKGLPLIEGLPLKYKFVKCAKRGNDVYRFLVNQRLEPLRNLGTITFFDESWGTKTTRLLFVTLTYDTKRCDSDTAWDSIGKEFHLWCNNLRKHYDCKIELFRTWESTKSLYPHVHLLLLFPDKDFEIFEHRDKDDKRTFRISNTERDVISSYWHSNVDIQGVEDTQGAIKELVKYITKDLCSKKGDTTNALLWLHNKQSYSISKGFEDWLRTLFDIHNGIKEPSIDDLIYTDMANCNQPEYKWEFIGILRGCDLGFSHELWVIDIGKPPPDIQDKLDCEYVRWNALHGGR